MAEWREFPGFRSVLGGHLDGTLGALIASFGLLALEEPV
jgi:hypothetical protein